jgi:hypothetical protein
MRDRPLTAKEQTLSLRLSKDLGRPVTVYKEGDWIMHADGWNLVGYGRTPSDALNDARRKNECR